MKLACWKNPSLPVIPPCDGGIGGPALERWLRKHKPDVVVSYSEVAVELERLGYSIPKDIGFASLDLKVKEETISGLNENSFYIGQKAVDVLVGLLHRGERGIPECRRGCWWKARGCPGKTLRAQEPSGRDGNRKPEETRLLQ